MIFLALTLFVLSAASVNAQVRIGGDADPSLPLPPTHGHGPRAVIS
ncbi:MAG: hypothetical protein LBG15_01585 [Dysgonamonadaceae bacterium]|nr:hypothetical protein [Dysgonamonadaceae bacterium]